MRLNERVWVPATLLICAGLVGLASYWFSLRVNGASGSAVAALHVDFERGIAWVPGQGPVKLPRSKLELTCYLPAGSPSGEYEIRILGGSGQSVSGPSRARAFRGLYGQAVPVKVNAALLPTGDYTLEIRPPGQERPLRYTMRIVP